MGQVGPSYYQRSLNPDWRFRGVSSIARRSGLRFPRRAKVGIHSMAHNARVAAAEVPRHVIQRDNNRQHAFLSDDDCATL